MMAADGFGGTAMPASGRYSHEQRTQYLDMTGRIGRRWLDVFAGNTDFYSAAYWDLLTGIWYQGGSVRKTEALKLMTAIKSAHTAGKYVESAIAQGILEETPNPEDGRSRLLALSPAMRRRLDLFFDDAVGELQGANRAIEAAPKGTRRG